MSEFSESVAMVIAVGHYFEIGYAVVALVSVYVVYSQSVGYFTDEGFRYEAVYIRCSISAYVYHAVSVFGCAYFKHLSSLTISPGRVAGICYKAVKAAYSAEVADSVFALKSFDWFPFFFH